MVTESRSTATDRGTANIGDIGATVDVRTIYLADTNNVSSCGNAGAGYIANGDIAAAGVVVTQRLNTDGNVVAASGVVQHCGLADGRVEAAGSV